MNRNEPLRGIVPPMITPLIENSRLDEPGLERLVEHMLEGGVHGLFVLGSTGEGPSISGALKKELVKHTAQILDKRVPLLVGITDTAFTESVRLAEYAADQGADAVVLAPPYYFRAGQPELIEYIGHMVDRLPLPLMLYNMPAMTKLELEPQTVKTLLALDGIIGLKDSSGNFEYFKEVLSMHTARQDLTFLIGPENLLYESMMAGGHGGVSGGANVYPKLFVALYNAATDHDDERCETLQEMVLKLRTLYRIGRHGSSSIKGLKCGLRLKGICSDFMAEPFHRFREPEREIVIKTLKELDAQMEEVL